MGFSSCCTHGDSPSPDAVSPRPLPTVPIASWSTRFSKAEDAAELQAIFEDRSEYDEQGLVLSKMGSSAIKAVKSKMRRHLSLESGLSKRHSRSSVGNSEEEVERRKELRRLRDKRIQEELSNDNYDEDAEAITFATVSNTDFSNNMFLPLPLTR
jgi:hypothetical protein